MNGSLYHARRITLSFLAEGLLRLFAWQQSLRTRRLARGQQAARYVLNPTRPEDVDPLGRDSLQNPYPYYRLLRDQRPVYQPAGADFWCVSRFHDIKELVKQTDSFSSNIVGVFADKRMGRKVGAQSLGSPRGSQRNWGIDPVDSLAIQDAPAHGYQRALTQDMLAPDFVKSLEGDVRALACALMDGFVAQGRTDFMQSVAWRLPMTMAIRLVGFPEDDYPRIKRWCGDAIALLSGISSHGEFARNAAGGVAFFRYTWAQYEMARRNPQDNLTGRLIRAADDPQHPLTHEEAVSIIFQVLIAGSDSSASTMGNAVKMLIENPGMERRLRAEPGRIPAFIEEVFRLQSAFQGHFRITREDVSLHGVQMPKGSRVLLLWASANRDERFWQNAEALDIDREHLRRHLTFGFGPHACLGRELARMEIRIALEELLRRTQRLTIVGPTPYVASIFTRTLVELPIAFELAEVGGAPVMSTSTTTTEGCPFHGGAVALG